MRKSESSYRSYIIQYKTLEFFNKKYIDKSIDPLIRLYNLGDLRQPIIDSQLTLLQIH